MAHSAWSLERVLRVMFYPVATARDALRKLRPSRVFSSGIAKRSDPPQASASEEKGPAREALSELREALDELRRSDTRQASVNEGKKQAREELSELREILNEIEENEAKLQGEMSPGALERARKSRDANSGENLTEKDREADQKLQDQYFSKYVSLRARLIKERGSISEGIRNAESHLQYSEKFEADLHDEQQAEREIESEVLPLLGEWIRERRRADLREGQVRAEEEYWSPEGLIEALREARAPQKVSERDQLIVKRILARRSVSMARDTVSKAAAEQLVARLSSEIAIETMAMRAGAKRNQLEN